MQSAKWAVDLCNGRSRTCSLALEEIGRLETGKQLESWLTCKLRGETMVTSWYMRSGEAWNKSGRASFIASSSAADAVAGTPYHT